MSHVKYHTDVYQGGDEWLALRRGLLTASEMKHIITPKTLAYASNDKERAHLYELVAQRVSGYTEPCYVGDDMVRGMEDEIHARIAYAEKFAPVREVGFITNDKWGFKLGYSPDGLVGDDGAIEVKGRKQKFQVQTIIDWEMPNEYLIQVQSGLLISERSWCDFISYHGGLPMAVIRVHNDTVVQDAIKEAAAIFEAKIAAKVLAYRMQLESMASNLIATERRLEQEIRV